MTTTTTTTSAQMEDMFDAFRPFDSPFGSETDSTSTLFTQGYGDDDNMPCQDPSLDEGREGFFFQPQVSDSGSLSTGESGSPYSQSSSSSYTASSSSPVSSGAISYESPSISQVDDMMPESAALGYVTVQPSMVMPTVAPGATMSAPERKKRRQSPQGRTQKQKPVGKKRKAHSEESIVLDMDKLNSMNSAELEALLARLSSAGTLNADDERKLKAIKRQVKNRESAQMSRIRHRDYLKCVEAELEHEKEVNKRLRDYVDLLKGKLLEAGGDVPPDPELPVFVPPSPSELSLVEPSRMPVRPLRTAGICLMMFVLSVGIVMNVMHHMSPSSSVTTPNADNKNSLVPVPAQPAEPSSRVMVDTSSAQLPQISAAPKSCQPAPPPDTGNVIRESAYLSYDTEKDDSSTLALVIPETKQEQVSSDALVPRSSVFVMPYATKVIFGNAKPRLADESWALDNTSYILVNDPTEFVPRSVDLDDVQARTEPVIGLLIPASSFNIPNLAPDDVVELVCGIRNATLIPRSVLARSL